MKNIILAFSLLINSGFSGLVMAEDSKVTLSTSQDVFNSKWNFSPLIIKEDGEAKVHTKIFKRLLWINKTAVPVIDTNFVYLENPKQDSDPKKNELSFIAESIKNSFGKDMQISGEKDSLNIEGKFEKLNRYIKVSLSKKDNHVIIVTSFARLGLYDKLKPEVEELHALLVKYEGDIKVKTKKTTWFKWPTLVDEAVAQAATLSLMNLLGGFNNGNSSTSYSFTGNFGGITSSLNDLQNGVGTLNNNWQNTNNQIGNTNTQIGNVNTSIGNTNAQLGVANGNWANTNSQIGDFNKNVDKLNTSAIEANKNWADTNKEISKANVTAAKAVGEVKEMNTNWAESNKILAQAMDPNHMAKIGFYTAAGAALGGLTVNLAVQGVSEGIGFLHELFTGAKKKKLEWSDFEKAMQAWDNQLNDLVKMEQVVDSYLAAFDFFEGKTIGNDYIKQLNNAVRDMKFDRDLFMEKFKDQNMDVSCRKLYYNAADELDQKVKEYDKILQFASNNNISINGGASYFCNQLKELQRKILGAENQMQDLRLKILVAENQYYGKQSEDIDKRDEDIDKINNRMAKTMDEKKAYDAKVMDRIKETHVQTKAAWLESCMEGKSSEGLAVKEELTNTFFLYAYFKKRYLCSDRFSKVEASLKKRDEESVKRLAAEEVMRKDLVVKSNNSVEMKLSEEQMSWMSRVHMDAYCYQFAHEPENKIPAKCKNFPELLYSMSLSKGYEKAKNAYQNKCEDRYLSGLKQLANSDAK